MSRHLAAFATAILIGLPAIAQIPEGWIIKEIFPAGTEFFCGRPDINDRGQIVFHRQLWPERTELEIFGHDRGRLVRFTHDSVYDAFPRLNNHGVVVWQRDFDPDPSTERVAIFSSIEVQVTHPESTHGDFGADMNDAGEIVFSRAPIIGSDSTDVWMQTPERETQVTKSSQSDQSARINHRGDLVFTQYDFSVSPWLSEILAFFDNRLMRISRPRDTVQSPDLNNLREVVWHSNYRGVELWKDGTIRPVVARNAAGAHINNRGDICLGRWDAINAENGLWLVRNGVLLQLTDGSFGGNFSALNERGEIAFQFGRVPSYGIALFTKPCFAADIDLDGDADLGDFAVLQREFGLSDPLQDAFSRFPSDIMNDAAINERDVALFVNLIGGPE